MSGCPCGLTGINCEDLVPPLTSADDAPDQACVSPGFARCIISEDLASCQCNCGFEGDFCETKQVPLNFNFGVGITIGIVLMVLFSCILLRDSKRHDRWQGITKEDFTKSTLSYIGPKAILGWRCANLLLCFVVYIREMMILGAPSLAAYTLWSWTAFGLTFLFGSIIAGRNVMHPEAAKEGPTRLEKAYFTCYQVSSPAALLVFFVVWLVLLPEAKQTGTEDQVVNGRSFVYHASNVVLLLIEGFTTPLGFYAVQVFHLMTYSVLYLTFHMVFMLARLLAGLDHCPVYGFLNMSVPFFVALAYAFLIPLVLFYFIWMGIMQLKIKCFLKGQDKALSKEEPKNEAKNESVTINNQETL